MATRLRRLALPTLILLAAVLYYTRVRHEMIDFITWREAVVRALHAEPLYVMEDGHYQFKYFPAFALVMAPFGVLDRDRGKMLWFAIELGLMAALLRWSVRALPGRRLSEQMLVSLAFVLMAKFYFHEVMLGQTNLLLGTLLVAALLAIQANRPIVGGAFVGAAVFAKPYALVLLPWLVVTRRWPAAAAATGIVIAGLLLPITVYGWIGNLDLLRGWLRTVNDSTPPLLLNNDNISIAAMWAKWLGPDGLASGLAWLTVAGAALLVIAVLWRRRSVAKPEYLECALLMLLVPLVSPQGWDYVLLLATPAVVCLADRWRDFTPPWRVALGVALAGMSLTVFDIMGRTLYGRFMALSLISVCALALAAILVHTRWRGLA